MCGEAAGREILGFVWGKGRHGLETVVQSHLKHADVGYRPIPMLQVHTIPS
jgi:hypothetical protein